MEAPQDNLQSLADSDLFGDYPLQEPAEEEEEKKSARDACAEEVQNVLEARKERVPRHQAHGSDHLLLGHRGVTGVYQYGPCCPGSTHCVRVLCSAGTGLAAPVVTSSWALVAGWTGYTLK